MDEADVQRVMHEQNVLRETAVDVVRRRLSFEAKRDAIRTADGALIVTTDIKESK